MLIDRPLREYDVGLLGGDDLREGLVVLIVYDGASVVLICEGGVGFQDAACFDGFGGSDFRTMAESGGSAIAFASVQIEQSYLMAEIGVAGDGSRAATFGISGMASGDDDLQSLRRGSQRQ